MMDYVPVKKAVYGYRIEQRKDGVRFVRRLCDEHGDWSDGHSFFLPNDLANALLTKINPKDIIILAKIKGGTATCYRQRIRNFFEKNNLNGFLNMLLETDEKITILCVLPNLKLLHRITRIIKLIHFKQKPDKIERLEWSKNISILTLDGFSSMSETLGLIC